jgi:hypothetical protein
MTRMMMTVLVIAAALAGGAMREAAAQDAAPDAKGKVCRMEKQCRWENFKKICVNVKVCR